MPLWVRKFLTDFIEVVIPALVLIQVVLPSDMDGMVKIAGAIAAAVGSALMSAGRRNWPAFMVWVREKLGTTPSI